MGSVRRRKAVSHMYTYQDHTYIHAYVHKSGDSSSYPILAVHTPTHARMHPHPHTLYRHDVHNTKPCSAVYNLVTFVAFGDI